MNRLLVKFGWIQQDGSKNGMRKYTYSTISRCNGILLKTCLNTWSFSTPAGLRDKNAVYSEQKCILNLSLKSANRTRQLTIIILPQIFKVF